MGGCDRGIDFYEIRVSKNNGAAKQMAGWYLRMWHQQKFRKPLDGFLNQFFELDRKVDITQEDAFDRVNIFLRVHDSRDWEMVTYVFGD